METLTAYLTELLNWISELFSSFDLQGIWDSIASLL